MDKGRIDELFRQLHNSGYINEILDSEGKIEPSETALEKIRGAYPTTSKEEAAEAWQLAQAETLLELAAKYNVEMN